LGYGRFNQLLEGVKGLLQKFVILTGAAKLDGHLTEDVQSLLRVHPLNRGQTRILGKNFVERLVGGPSVGLRLGGVDQLGAHLRTGSVKELAVGNGGTVLIIDVSRKEPGGSLRAGRGPDGYGGDGDDVIHRERLEGDGGNLVRGAGGVLDDDVAGGGRSPGDVSVADLERTTNLNRACCATK